jgi:hypothetical protein
VGPPGSSCGPAPDRRRRGRLLWEPWCTASTRSACVRR